MPKSVRLQVSPPSVVRSTADAPDSSAAPDALPTIQARRASVAAMALAVSSACSTTVQPAPPSVVASTVPASVTSQPVWASAKATSTPRCGRKNS